MNTKKSLKGFMKNSIPKRVALITRIELINEEDEIKYFRNGLNVFLESEIISKIYILSDQLSKDNLNLQNEKINFLVLPDPTSPISINYALDRIESSELYEDYFLVISKEVEIRNEQIKNLISYFNDNDRDELLVVGYKFKIKNNKSLDNELQNFYNNELLIANRVPWNTCALWNFKLFKKIVEKFDEITINNSFSSVLVSLDNACYETPHRGMEDGLAIAKAASRRKGKLYKLSNKPPLLWSVKNSRIQSHRKKLARKDKVLRDYMAIRNYSEKDLLNAEL